MHTSVGEVNGAGVEEPSALPGSLPTAGSHQAMGLALALLSSQACMLERENSCFGGSMTLSAGFTHLTGH